MNEQALIRFRTEIRHFFNVSVQNLVFSSLAIVAGLIYIVTAVHGTTPGIPTPELSWGLRLLIGALSMISLGLGISWTISSRKIVQGVEDVKTNLDKKGSKITDDEISCLIVRMLAHYRDNRDTIHMMINVCMTGGCAFLFLGFLSSLEFLKITGNGTEFFVRAYPLIPVVLVYLGIALQSLRSSYYFSKFVKVWDERLTEIEESECALKKKLGLDEA